MTSILLMALAATAPPVPARPAGNPQSWVAADDYPGEAIRAGEQGTVAFRLDVDTVGAVTGCAVTDSSGSTRLDAKTCALMQARARFVPARDRRGRTVASSWSSHFAWRLPLAAAATAGIRPLPLDPQSWVTDEDYPPEALRAGVTGTVQIHLDVDPAGATTACTILDSSGSALLDAKTCELLRVRAHFRPARDAAGKAIASSWAARFTWRVPDKDESEERNGFAVTTYELKPDGEIVSCRTVAEAGAHIEYDPCASVARGQPPGWVTKYAPRFRTLRLQAGSAEVGTMPAMPPPEWGTLLARRLSTLAFNEAEVLIDCTIVASEGPAEVRPDLCASSKPAPPASGTSREVTFRLIDGWAIYGVPRAER